MIKTSITGSVLLNTGFSKLYGFSIKSTAVDVEIKFKNGISGSNVVFVTLGDDQSVQQWLSTPLILPEGLYVYSSDTIEGSVWWSEYEETDGGVEYPIRDNTRGRYAP